jgi:hypothetical protein
VRVFGVRGRRAAALAVTMTAMTAMPTVPAMHEQVHEGAGEDQQKREKPERVGSVFREKQEGPDQQEADRHKEVQNDEGRSGSCSRLLFAGITLCAR